MKNQAYHMTMLYDFYGDLLTDRQKEFYELYYDEDLSLSEIAENYGISRQGVRDVIVRAETTMADVEEKTHLLRRFFKMQEEVKAINEAVERLLAAESQDLLSDEIVEDVAKTILENTQKLVQE